jgi:hypothetical protein
VGTAGTSAYFSQGGHVEGGRAMDNPAFEAAAVGALDGAEVK